MRCAMSGSLLVHAALFGMALLGFSWTVDDAPAPGIVVVDIIPTDTVSSDQHASVVSSAALNQVSSGSTDMPRPALEPVKPESLAPQPADQGLETRPATLQAMPVQTLQAIASPIGEPVLAAANVAPLVADAAVLQSPTALQTIPQLTSATEAPPRIDPIAVADAKVAPVPHQLTLQRPSTPTSRIETPKPMAATPAAQPAGNGGANNADSAASRASAGKQGGAGGGGTAAIAAWEKQVRRALANARRYPRSANGASGEAIVRFSVSASGALLDLRIITSSGNGALDDAARETVSRAAPFPTLPAGMANQTVQVPLAFLNDRT